MQAWYFVFIIPVDFPEDFELQRKMHIFLQTECWIQKYHFICRRCSFYFVPKESETVQRFFSPCISTLEAKKSVEIAL